ncbi:MAG: helix-turn-helix domain-containing protein [Candidatus Aminicenantales bacterium]
MKEKQYLTIPQLAEILGLSRIAVYKKVKKGEIKAIKIGKNYAIPEEYISEIRGKNLSNKTKRKIEKAVKKTIKDYGEVLRLLGND